MSIRWKILACLWLAAGNAVAQDALPYQTPPAEILQLADVQRPPSVVADSGKTRLVLFYRDAFKSLAELSDEELRLGGLRVNPRTNIASTATYFNNLQVQELAGGTARQVTGLPTVPRLANFVWSLSLIRSAGAACGAAPCSIVSMSPQAEFGFACNVASAPPGSKGPVGRAKLGPIAAGHRKAMSGSVEERAPS